MRVTEERFDEVNMRQRKIVPWSGDEKAAIQPKLGKFIAGLTPPGKAGCLRATAAESALSRRAWYSRVQKEIPGLFTDRVPVV